MQVNANVSPITFKTNVKSTAPANQITNVATIYSPTDASSISQRKSEVGINVSVPATLNIVKSTANTNLMEASTD